MSVLPECTPRPHVQAVPAEARSGWWSPSPEVSTDSCENTMLVLEREPEASRKAAYALYARNHWAAALGPSFNYVFKDTVSLCNSAAVLELTLLARLTLNSQRPACFCLPHAGVKGMCLYVSILVIFFSLSTPPRSSYLRSLFLVVNLAITEN